MSITVIGGDYGPPDVLGGTYPKRVHVRVEGEIIRNIGVGGSGRPHQSDVFVDLLLHEDGTVSWDKQKFLHSYVYSKEERDADLHRPLS